MTIEERNKFVEENVNLVYYYLNKHFWGYRHNDDVVQVAMEAFITALDKFDPNAGFTLSSYACKAIYRTVLRYLDREKRVHDIVTVPINDELDSELLIQDNVDFEQFSETEIDSFCSVLNLSEQAIVRYRLQELNQSEIARKMGVSKQRISIQLQNIRKKYIKWKETNYI